MDVNELREIAENRMKNIFDVEQQEYFKTIFGSFFEEVLIKQMEFNSDLMKRVLNDVENKDWSYDIYCTLLSKENLILYNDILTPILEDDLSDNIMPIKLLEEYIQNKIGFVLGKIYLDIPLSKIENVLSQEYEGEIYDKNGNVYNVGIKLEEDNRYKEKERELYEGFIISGRQWKTILNPYGKRFFYVKVTDYKNEIPEDIEVEKITYSLLEYDEFKKENQICVWNVCKTEIKSKGFPIELGNKLGYELDILLDSSNISGYVFTGNNKSIINISRDRKYLKVRTIRMDMKKWDSFEIKNCNRLKKAHLINKLYGNNKTRDTIDYYKQGSLGIIRTKGEINRFINVFDVSKNIKLKDAILEDYKEDDFENKGYYSDNEFIKDEIRDGKKSNVLRLKFTKKGELGTYVEDVIQFLISELSLYFPEYACVSEVFVNE